MQIVILQFAICILQSRAVMVTRTRCRGLFFQALAIRRERYDARFCYLSDANFNVTTLVDTAGDAIERYVHSPYDATWSNIRSSSIYDNEYV